MSVTLFIQDHSGDCNYDRSFDDDDCAKRALKLIVANGGYWYDELMFIPWQRADYAEIRHALPL